MTEEAATTPLTNVQLAQQILLWIRRYQQEIRGQSKIDIALRRSLLITEIETLCKEQIGKKPMATQEEQPNDTQEIAHRMTVHVQDPDL
jgi:hypothetical protein